MTARDPDPVAKDLEVSGVTHAARQPVTSLYIHVPFCLSKCLYCDFYSITDCISEWIGRWQRGVILELERIAGEAASHKVRTAPLQTVYFGGGTPSVLPHQVIVSLIERARTLFSFEASCDITLEANPESYNSEKKAGSLGSLAAAGVNRISFGLQSSSDAILSSIGRRHTAADAEFAIAAASQAGFEHIAVDLMTGLPGQTLESIHETLDMVRSLPVDHVSSYALCIAEGTPFDSLFKASPGLFPQDDLERAMTRQVTASLKSRGFEHYEISNFAKPGARSRHNLTYWEADPYMAAGPAAASYMRGVRRCSPASLEQWLTRVEDAGEGPFGQASIEERVDEASARIETMVLGLRLLDGVSRARFKERHGTGYDQVFGGRLRQLQRRGLLVCEETRVRLTEKGLDFADLVARELL